ncbi:hypothetical protein Tco_0408494 [Tanacetum coccineum]
MGIMPTEMELTLEQTQQGVSHEVSKVLKGLKNEKEIFDTSAGNPIKEILLKLNLPDYRSIFTDSKMEVKISVGNQDKRELCKVFSAIKELVDIVKKTLELGARGEE